MTTYAIGDIQGCKAVLDRLLYRLKFDPAHDTLWLCGDLVNRGPDSLATLRWARAQGDAVLSVLGNHDLKLLMLAHAATGTEPEDSLAAILRAPDANVLIDWLLHRPFLHVENGHALVHAGILPNWSLAQAEDLAAQAAKRLQDRASAAAFLVALAQPHGPIYQASAQQTASDLQIFAAKVFTYMRVCNAVGDVYLNFTGPPQASPQGFLPWFVCPRAAPLGAQVVCGHWSALGLHLSDGIYALDTGCVWGQQLTAINLDNAQVTQEAARI